MSFTSKVVAAFIACSTSGASSAEVHPEHSKDTDALQIASEYERVASQFPLCRTLLLNGTFSVDVLHGEMPRDVPEITEREATDEDAGSIWAMPPIYMEVSFNGRHWIQALSRAAPTEKEVEAVSFNSPFLIGGWDGEKWSERSPHTDRGPTFRLEKVPPRGGEEDCLPYFNHTTGPGMVAALSVPGLLRRAVESGKPITVDRLDLDELGPAIRLAFEHPAGDTNTIEFTFLLEPHIRLQSAIYNFYRFEGDGPDRARIDVAKLHYHVGEWMTFHDLMLPRIAYRDGYKLGMATARAKNEPPSGARTILKRLAITPITPEEFEERIPAIQDGDHILDERGRIRFREGRKTVEIDAFVFAAERPLRADDLMHLDNVISPQAQAEGIPIEQVIAYQESLSRNEFFRQIVIVVGSVALVVIVSTFFLKRRQAE